MFRTWLVWAEAFGLGELALTPTQFWRLTPHEFQVLRAGFHRREERAWERIATLGCWVLAPHTKKKHTPASLLGRSKLTTLPPGPQDDLAALEVEKARVIAEAIAWATGD